ncbi:MAG: hypothetical protein ACRDSR_06715 [Pseudonocardiaceae bacterium]
MKSYADRALSRRPGDDTLAAGYAEALQTAEAHSVWDADRRAALAIAGLGLERIGRGRSARFVVGRRA